MHHTYMHRSSVSSGHEGINIIVEYGHICTVTLSWLYFPAVPELHILANVRDKWACERGLGLESLIGMPGIMV